MANSTNTTKTITFDENKFLTYKDFLTGHYETMGGEFIKTHTNANISDDGEITHAEIDKFITLNMLESDDDKVFKESFAGIKSDVLFGNGSNEYPDECFLRLKSMTYYEEPEEEPEEELYEINGEYLRIFTTYDLYENTNHRINIYEKLKVCFYDINKEYMNEMEPSSTDFDIYGEDIESTWEYFEYGKRKPYLAKDHSISPAYYNWFKMYTDTTMSFEKTNRPKYLRIYAPSCADFDLEIYDNIKNSCYEVSTGMEWRLVMCAKWTKVESTDGDYYERELDMDDLDKLENL